MADDDDCNKMTLLGAAAAALVPVIIIVRRRRRPRQRLNDCMTLHGAAPPYLSDQLQYVADLPTRRRGRLRSLTSSLLDVRPSRCVTVGDRSFATAGPRLWNSLPADVRSASSLTAFRQKLKTHLFPQSYPDIVL